MKDLPHHIKKLNRKVIRSSRKTEAEELMPEVPTQKPTVREIKKKGKQKIKADKAARAPSNPTPEERNKKMKARVPVFDRINNAKPKRTRSSKKKTPKI